MALGACAGFMAGYATDNLLLAWLAAFAAGLGGALIYAVLTVTFMANQNVAGLTLTIFGVGLSNFFGIYMLGKSESGSLKLPEAVTAQMRSVNIRCSATCRWWGRCCSSTIPLSTWASRWRWSAPGTCSAPRPA